MQLARKVPSAAALRSGRGSPGRCGCMDGVRARHVRDIGRGRAPSGRAVLNWYYVMVGAVFLVLVIWLGASRYHSVRLGWGGERPEYKMTAKLSMLFAAGTGV